MNSHSSPTRLHVVPVEIVHSLACPPTDASAKKAGVAFAIVCHHRPHAQANAWPRIDAS